MDTRYWWAAGLFAIVIAAIAGLWTLLLPRIDPAPLAVAAAAAYGAALLLDLLPPGQPRDTRGTPLQPATRLAAASALGGIAALMTITVAITAIGPGDDTADARLVLASPGDADPTPEDVAAPTGTPHIALANATATPTPSPTPTPTTEPVPPTPTVPDNPFANCTRVEGSIHTCGDQPWRATSSTPKAPSPTPSPASGAAGAKPSSPSASNTSTTPATAQPIDGPPPNPPPSSTPAPGSFTHGGPNSRLSHAAPPRVSFAPHERTRIMTQPNEWLDQVQEPILEPDLPICDPHHHLWDRNGSRYLQDELLADTGSGHNVVSTVFVECMSMYRNDGPDAFKVVGETEFVQGIAAMFASGGYGPTRACAGIVSYADLSLGDLAGNVLEAHLAASPNRFRGIRHATSWHPSPDIRNAHTRPPEGLMADPTFRQGFAHLGRLGLSFDAWLYHEQIPELTNLARAFPGTTIILDHFGGPLGTGPYEGKADEVYETWKRNITELAACENVVVKIGGINMPINGFGWEHRETPPSSQELADATRRYYLHTIETFGPGRCMFESNFPVDKASVSYHVLWNSFKRLVADFPADEKAALFHDTAARVYRIGK